MKNISHFFETPDSKENMSQTPPLKSVCSSMYAKTALSMIGRGIDMDKDINKQAKDQQHQFERVENRMEDTYSETGCYTNKHSLVFARYIV